MKINNINVLLAVAIALTMFVVNQTRASNESWKNIRTENTVTSNNTIAFKPNDANTIVCASDKDITLWNLSTNKFESKYPSLRMQQINQINVIAFHPNQPNIIFIGTILGQILSFNLETGEQKIWDSSYYGNKALAFNPSGNMLAASSPTEHGITIYDTSNPEELQKKQTLSVSGCVALVCFHPTNKDILAYAWKEYVAIIKFSEKEKTYQCTALLNDHTDEVNAIAFHPTEKDIIASCSKDGTIRIWNISKKEQTDRCTAILEGHTDEVNALAFHPTDKNIIASCSKNGDIKIWQKQTIEIAEEARFAKKSWITQWWSTVVFKMRNMLTRLKSYLVEKKESREHTQIMRHAATSAVVKEQPYTPDIAQQAAEKK